jgi:long-chain fatty acid transport protein
MKKPQAGQPATSGPMTGEEKRMNATGHTSLRTPLLAALLMGAAAVPVPAQAAGFFLKEQSASAQGTAFAGVTAGGTNDASAMFFNPAAMAVVKGNQAIGNLSILMPTATIDGARGTRATALGGSAIAGNASPDDGGQDAVLPSGYAVWSATQDLKFGVAITSPWGLVTDYPEDWVGRYHALHSSLATVNIQPSVSYRVMPTLTLGAGAQIQYSKARLSQAVDFASIVRASTGLPLAPGSLDGASEVEGSSWGAGAVAGLLLEPHDGTRVGLSFRSAVYQELKGTAQFTNVPALSPAFSAAFANTGGRAKIVTPEIVSLGGYQKINDAWAVMADVNWTNWSRFKDLTVRFDNPLRSPSTTEENWKDTWAVAIGAAYQPTKELTLRTGFAFDQSPVPSASRTPRIPDNNRFWLSAGAGYAFTDSFQVDIAWSHLFVPDASLNLTDTLASPGAFRGNLSGTYNDKVDIVSIQAKLSF